MGCGVEERIVLDDKDVFVGDQEDWADRWLLVAQSMVHDKDGPRWFKEHWPYIDRALLLKGAIPYSCYKINNVICEGRSHG